MNSQWQEHGNPNVQTIHVDFELPIYATYFGSDPPPDAIGIRDAIMALCGVVAFSSRRYSLTVEKGVMFSWSQMREKVEAALTQYAEGRQP